MLRLLLALLLSSCVRLVNAQTPPARAIASYRWQAGELRVVTTDSVRLLVQPWAPGVVRVAVYPAGSLSAGSSSLAVSAPPAATGVTLTTTARQLLLQGPDLRVEIDRAPLRVRYLRAPLDTVLAELPDYPRSNGLTVAHFRLPAGELVYGTGARALPLNLHGQRLGFYNAPQYAYANGTPNLNCSIPLVLGGHGFGVLFDELQPGYLDAGQANSAILEYATEADHLTYFVFAQPTLPTLLAAYTHLTGHQPLPPRWALGYLQSKFGYQTETDGPHYRAAPAGGWLPTQRPGVGFVLVRGLAADG